MTKLYGYVSKLGAPEYDDIMQSDLPTEEKVKQIQMRGQAYRDEIDREHWKNMARIGLGGLVSAVGALPIAITKNPVIGSAIGGGVYELGQGIMEGNKAPELLARSGLGGVIGGVTGGLVSKAPQVSKYIDNLSGGRIGKQISKLGEKIATNPTVQKFEDVLMTDVKAFNPNKQTVYHGSPYDFNKFSNEAIGTGEGAQAHGMGHYTALDKNVADKRYRQKLLNNTQSNYIIDDVLLDGNYPLVNHNFNPESVIKDAEYYGGTNKLLEKYKKDYAEAIEEQARIKSKYSENADPYRDFDDIDQMLYSNANILEKNLKSKIPFLDSIKDKKITQNEGQLYKLSVPKDDVMWREGLEPHNQPKKVQEIYDKVLKQDTEKITNKYDNQIKNYKDAQINAWNKLTDYKLGNNSKYAKNLLQAELSEDKNLIDKAWEDYANNIGYDDVSTFDPNAVYDFKRNIQDHIFDLNKNKEQEIFWDLGREGYTNFKDPKIAKKWSDAGIKGISYNGGIDGEARVIFNPDDIDIVRKYYNQPSLADLLLNRTNYGGIGAAITD